MELDEAPPAQPVVNTVSSTEDSSGSSRYTTFTDDDDSGSGKRRLPINQGCSDDDESGSGKRRAPITGIVLPPATVTFVPPDTTNTTGQDEANAALALLSAAAVSPPPAATPSPQPGGPLADAWSMPADGAPTTLSAASAADRPPVAAFVRTLYKLLEGPKDVTHCEWSDAGKRIVFTNPRLFGEQVCPRHFRHSEWTSFSRMLNLYGFKKVSRTPRLGTALSRAQVAQVFEHPHFARGGAEDLHKIVRKKKKKASAPDDSAQRAAEVEAMRLAELESLRAPTRDLEKRLSRLEVENAALRRRLGEYEAASSGGTMEEGV